MKVPRVYVDTSVIGGCFDPEFALWSNALFKDFELGRLQPVVSKVVFAEIASAPPDIREKYASLIAAGAEMLEDSEEAKELHELYVQRGILGPKYTNDMWHIALATAAAVDVLVSWNFKHIVRFDKIRLFNAASLELGYRSIEIRSPREVTAYEQD